MANLGDRRLRPDNRIAEKFVPASDWTQDAKGNYLFVDLPGFKKKELRLELASTGHIIISGERIMDDKKSIYFQQTFPLPENSDNDNISAKFDGDFLHITVPRKSVVEENKQQESETENYSKSINGETGGHENQNKHEEGNGGDHDEQHRHENQTKHEEGNGGDHEHRGNEAKGDQTMSSKETNSVASFPEEMVKKWEWEQREGPLDLAMKFLKKNKGAVLSVVIAFSIGVLVCRKFESSSGE